MAILNDTNKQLLLNQLQKQNNVELQSLERLMQTYENLSINDLRGYVPQVIIEQLVESMRKPEEKALWNEIEAAPHSTPAEIQDLMRKVNTYIQRYAYAPKADEAQRRSSMLQDELQEALAEETKKAAAIREQKDWDSLEKGNYGALRTYKCKYPESVHLEEVEDLMWTNTKNAPTLPNFNRYIADWPSGRYVEEANKAIAEFSEWENIKRSRDIFLVDDYRDNHPDSPFKGDINSLYFILREEVLKKMKQNPSKFSRDDVMRFIATDIFKDYELKDEGLITDESWEKLQIDRSLFPNIQELQVVDPYITASADCTDIYLFGTPGTGKTCLLMGLCGANGKGYTLNMKSNGGSYASALSEYVRAGLTPGSTFGPFVTTINGQVTEDLGHERYVTHNINLVEMSGEEFALRIADDPNNATFDNMGTGAVNLLRNNNRKVFFIIVDCSDDKVKVEYVESVRDANGNIIEDRKRKKYVAQFAILDKFTSLFELPENQEFMKRVDAIHFVVTKADMLGEENVRLERARQLLLEKYEAPVERLKNYCRQTKRINASTDYHPYVFTFSLGKFYLGDVYDFDKTETRRIVDTIRYVTSGRKERTWWDRFKEAIN